MSHFAAIGQIIIEISRSFELQDDSRRPSWIFKNSQF